MQETDPCPGMLYLAGRQSGLDNVLFVSGVKRRDARGDCVRAKVPVDHFIVTQLLEGSCPSVKYLTTIRVVILHLPRRNYTYIYVCTCTYIRTCTYIDTLGEFATMFHYK